MGSGKHTDDNHDPAAAFNHGTRRRILRLMSDGRKASPREIADELGEKLSNVAYHVRILAACRALQPAGSRQVRGAKQHFYRWSLKQKWAREMLDEYDDEPPTKRKEGES